MKCLVTAGPTYEPLDDVRRLTNFSTGRLGTELAAHLTGCGHTVILLLGEQATWTATPEGYVVERFSTTADLAGRLRNHGQSAVAAVFHAAAVSDFTFGKTWSRSSDGQLHEVRSGKLSTRDGTLMAELVPTTKILPQLRGWYPQAFIAGWKYEVEGGQAEVLSHARRQLQEARTDACVANGPAYGPGFGLTHQSGEVRHLANKAQLFAALEQLALARG
jgi:phosphopantothenoylcysteine decarboxylase/phosphopantothenate--cysteine ligase